MPRGAKWEGTGAGSHRPAQAGHVGGWGGTGLRAGAQPGCPKGRSGRGQHWLTRSKAGWLRERLQDAPIGRWLRRITYALEQTPLTQYALSHFLVVTKE